MEIHSFLLDILKLIIPIATALLSLSIAFIDKINLDLTVKKTKSALVSLWLSLICTIIFAIATSFFVYKDVDYNKQSQKLSEVITLNKNEIENLVKNIYKNEDDTEKILFYLDSLEKSPDIQRSAEVQTCFFITLLGFLFSILQLIRIGFIVIKQKTTTSDSRDL